MRGRRPKDQITADQQVSIANRLLQLRRSGKIQRVWVDRCIVRVDLGNRLDNPVLKRIGSWLDAQRFLERMEASE